jgi:hypothetical protein
VVVVFAHAAVRFEFCFVVAGHASASVVLIGCLDSLAVSEARTIHSATL